MKRTWCNSFFAQNVIKNTFCEIFLLNVGNVLAVQHANLLKKYVIKLKLVYIKYYFVVKFLFAWPIVYVSSPLEVF